VRTFTWAQAEDILKELPTTLRTEVSLHMHHKIVEKIYFFQDKDPGFISAVIPKLRNLRLEAGETVYKEHEYPEEVYFLTKGRVNLLASNGFTFKSYVQGSYFGEGEVLEGRNRDCTVEVAEPGAKFMLLHKHDFLHLLEQFPKIAEEITETARLRTIKNREAKEFALKSVSSLPNYDLAKAITTAQTQNNLTVTDGTPQSELLKLNSLTKKKKKSLLRKEAHRRVWKGLIDHKKDTSDPKKWDFLVHKIFKPKDPSRRKSHLLEANLSPDPTGSRLGLVEKAMLFHPSPSSKWNILRNNREKFKKSVVESPHEEPSISKLHSHEVSMCPSVSNIAWFADEVQVRSPDLSQDENDTNSKLVLLNTVLKHLSKHELRIMYKMSVAKLNIETIEQNFERMENELGRIKEYLK
jgi:CRP-like cAMP-binding protein